MPRAKKNKRGNGEGTEPRLHKSGLYVIYISLGHKPNGTRDRRAVYGKTKELARSKRDALLHENRQGKIAHSDSISFGEWLEKWLQGRKPHIAKTTHDLYAFRIRKWIPDRYKQMRLQAIKRGEMRDLLAYLANKNLSSGERSRLLQHITAAFEEAIDRELIAVNPSRGMKIQATQAEESKTLRTAQIALTPEARDLFLDAAKNDPFYPLFYTMFSLGLRRGEALGLRWTDVDFITGTVQISQQIRVEDSKPVIAIVKTKKSKRTLTASQDLLEVLRLRRALQEQHQRTLGNSWTVSNLVFTTTLGTMIHPRNLNRTIDRICKNSELTHFSSHAARKTFITDLLREGEKLEVVSALAGHSRPSITSDIYRTVMEDETRSVVYSIAERRKTRILAQA
jgi:integrase